MDKKIAYIAVAIIAIVAIAAITLLMTGNSSNDKSDNTDMSSETDGIRLTIFGNANGDDVIDEKDKAIVEKIVSDNIADWKSKYVYADANQDGSITSADAEVIQSYIDRKSTTLYYLDYFGNVAHIPYPIGDKVGVDHPYPALLMATAGLYDKVYAVDDMTGMYYDETTFPGLNDMRIIGSSTKITLEQVAASGVDAFIIYSNWSGCCYLYEQADKSGLADKVAFISVDIKADDGYTGTLMLGALFNDGNSMDTALDYARMTKEVTEALDSAKIDKETVVFDYIAKFGDDYYQYICGGATNIVSYKVVNFTEEYKDKGSVMVDEETLVAAAKGIPIFIQFQAPSGVERADMKEYLQERMQAMLTKTDAYSSEEIYAVDSDLINSVGAIFGAYVTGAMLYDAFDYEKAKEYVAYFLKNFTPSKPQSIDGFMYTNTELFGTS